ncbi:MAG: NAD(P)-dependent oxidoreductase, partial [Pyramidobacter sp.]|nr:NAD(P)-dependent oxidoreductase [Pyramidobacter sp.]
GEPIAANLMKAGFGLHVWARTPAKAQSLLRAGAIWHDSAAAAAQAADAVITMLGEPKDVESVWLGAGGLIETAREGTILIDMTTSSPSLAVRLAAEGAKRGLRVLDCPVTGGRAGAESGKLALFVGGERADFDACASVWRAVSARASHMGPAGSGQAAKAANQIAVAGVLSGVCESLAYARAAGLDLDELFPLLCAGSAKSSQLEKIGAKILAADDTPTFFARYLAKDLRIGVSEAAALGLTLEVALATLANLDEITARGMGELGTQALIHHYERS